MVKIAINGFGRIGRLAFRQIFLLAALQLRDLCVDPGRFCLDGFHQSQFLLPVAFCRRCQYSQIGDMAQSSIAFCLHSCHFCPDYTDAIGNFRHLLVRITGYNAYFVSIGRELQDEVIARESHMGY